MLSLQGHSAPPRPRSLTAALLELAALEMADALIRDGLGKGRPRSAIAQAIQRVNPPPLADGYALARRLDDLEGWICGSDLVDCLDAWSSIAGRHLQALERQWAEAHRVEAALPAGTRVTIIGTEESGTIAGASSHVVASYLVALDGDPEAVPPTNARRVVGAEHVRPSG